MNKTDLLIAAIAILPTAILTSCDDDDKEPEIPVVDCVTVKDNTVAPGDTVKAELKLKFQGKYVKVTYAYAIRYLNTALDYIRDREKKEKELLDAIDPKICEDPDWPVKLSEWKLSNDERPVREMNEFQSKRFARSMGYDV